MGRSPVRSSPPATPKEPGNPLVTPSARKAESLTGSPQPLIVHTPPSMGRSPGRSSPPATPKEPGTPLVTPSARKAETLTGSPKTAIVRAPLSMGRSQGRTSPPATPKEPGTPAATLSPPKAATPTGSPQPANVQAPLVLGRISGRSSPPATPKASGIPVVSPSPAHSEIPSPVLCSGGEAPTALLASLAAGWAGSLSMGVSIGYSLPASYSLDRARNTTSGEGVSGHEVFRYDARECRWVHFDARSFTRLQVV
ncbi:hypothetical protein V5799_004785 [Amblyomma americanum]|uniref:Uncharacterized protein n=1 Tax=Amblyomma americanum TaxID=6943 RepID=A0AAQ4D544_AMBAM